MVRVAAAAGIVLSIVLAGCGSVAPSDATGPGSAPPGQTRLEYELVPVDGREPTDSDVDAVRSVVEQRVAALGVVDPIVSVESNHVVIDGLDPGDLAVVRSLVSTEGRIDFVPFGSEAVERGALVDRSAHPPLFSGDQIATASLGSDQNGGPAIELVLRDEGRTQFATYTAASIGDWFAITIDDRVIAAPVINGAIMDGNVEISGGFTPDEASRIVTILRFGSLPFPIRELAAPTPT